MSTPLVAAFAVIVTAAAAPVAIDEALPKIIYFPKGDKQCLKIGEGRGQGFNVNFSLKHELVNNDMLAVFDFLFLPLAKHYKPDFVLVSAGFDAAIGDLGKSFVTPDCYGQLIRKIKNTLNGKLVLALEDGYDLESLAASCAGCVEELLNSQTVDDVKCKLEEVHKETLAAMKEVKSALLEFWPCLAEVDLDLK